MCSFGLLNGELLEGGPVVLLRVALDFLHAVKRSINWIRVIDMLQINVCRLDFCIVTTVIICIERISEAMELFIDVEERDIFLDFLLDDSNSSQNWVKVIILPYSSNKRQKISP